MSPNIRRLRWCLMLGIATPIYLAAISGLLPTLASFVGVSPYVLLAVYLVIGPLVIAMGYTRRPALRLIQGGRS